jgi:protocatechuate 3,4-dioxygenase beta subunit
MSDHHHDGIEEHDLGLTHDLSRIAEQRRSLGRRGLLGLFGGLGAVAVVGCATESDGSTSSATATTATGGPGGAPPGGAPPGGGGAVGGDTGVEVADGEIPEETAGPYPGDGSNGPDVLSESGVVRSDITTNFAGATGVATGVPVTVRLKVYDLDGEDATILEGAAIYLWHCDANGSYSMYDGDALDQNYLRGVQVADADGMVEFTTIFPACYSGRWPHMHFEVYPSVTEATSAENKLRTTQLAIPEAACHEVYGVVDGYESSVSTFAGISLDTDGIFSDGYSLQLAKVTGSATDGYTFNLSVPV